MFSVTTAVVAVMTSILLFYLIKAGKNIFILTEALKGGLKESGELAAELKERLGNNIIFRLFFPSSRKRKKPSPKDKDSEIDH